MLTTNTELFYPDLMEVVNLFEEGAVLSIVHTGRNDGSFYEHTVAVEDGRFSYAYPRSENASATEEKRLFKRSAKLAVYRALSDYTGKRMPWGSLTGIRPTKLAYQNNADFERFFLDEMLVSPEKTALVGRILQAQKGVYEKDDDNCDFFVGIPFCPSRCAYCSFVSGDIRKNAALVQPYVDTLIKEIETSKSLVKKLRSVYVGGGTPVALPLSELKRVLDAIGPQRVEYTVEAGRPDAINAENVALLKEYGVTRICLNPQTFQDKTLERIGRRHTVRDLYDCYPLTDGFSVNMDLIAGLPRENFEDFRDSLDRCTELEPDNITVHTLALKRGSVLKEATDRLPAGEVERMVEYAQETLSAKGYEPYYLYRQKYMAGNLENTGYTKRGKACVYNIDVMEEIAQNVACGANAVSKAVFGGGERIERYGAPKDISSYIAKIDRIIEEKQKLFP